MTLEFHPVPKPNHKRRVKHRGERSKFSKMVRDEVKKHFDDRCAECGKHGIHVHHVMPRSRGGRNVFTNALLLCNDCHKEVHADNEKLNGWINLFKRMYGKYFYMDKDDIKHRELLYQEKLDEKEIREWKLYNGKFKY